MKSLLLFIAIFCIMNDRVQSQNELNGWGKIYPKDESESDITFSLFIMELKQAVENKNVNFIEGIISPVIELEYDYPSKNNYKSFMEKYELRDSMNEFWPIAKKILSLGAFSKKMDDSSVFFFPSVWFSDDYNRILGEEFYMGLDSTQNYANAVNQNVKVYKGAEESSEIIGKLNYEIVKIINFDHRKFTDWYKIELKDGSMGYVKNEDLYLSMFDYFMTFKKVNGDWEMVAFERTII
ncbi:MAG: SH3 domain-containing protein [Ignavibacteria bacterium]